MRRQWNNFNTAPSEHSVRLATGLGFLADEDFVRSVIAVKEAVDEGESARIVAIRHKFDPGTGTPLPEDYEYDPSAGGPAPDFVTVGYAFRIGDDDEVEIGRDQNFEGEPSAQGFASALGTIAGPEFVEAFVQAKACLDRIGGQFFVKPYVRDGQTVGHLFDYAHLAKDAQGEPGGSLFDPIPLPGSAPDGPRDDEDEVDAADSSPIPAEPEEGEEDADSPLPDVPNDNGAVPDEAEAVGAGT